MDAVTTDTETQHQPAAPLAIVSGGSSGLGLAVARTLLDNGYRVIIFGRDAQRLRQAESTLADAAARPGTLRTVTVDVTDAVAVGDCFEQLTAEQERLELLVNCVGRSDRGRTESLTPERLLDLVNDNVVSALLCSQAALPLLRRSRGVVVNVGSLASRIGARYLGGYPAAKHALAGLTQQMRLEWREYGVQVALLCPGPIRREDGGRRYQDRADQLPEAAKQPAGGANLAGLPPQRVAHEVLRIARRKRIETVLPRRVRLLITIATVLPRLGDWLVLKFTRGTPEDRR